jgi:F0F1-type ATP synthase assembly protein I
MSAEKRYPDWVRYSGIGLEFAGAVAGFALIGYWVDRHFATGPRGVIVGSMLGLVGGLYNLVKEALQASRDARLEDEQARGDLRAGRRPKDGA